MNIKFYNTANKKKEVFTPQNPERVTMYLCGPTVYNYAHIGNARPAVVFDVVFRLLQTHFPNVVYARNITDIDDKINQAAHDQGISIHDVTGKFIEAYHEDLERIGVLSPTIVPHATDHLPEMINMIERLVNTGHAYESEGHVLFDVTTFKQYGELSHRDLDDMLAGARIEIASYKKNPGDFVLWKPSNENQPGWDSPWGRGRPGWHIECSAMTEKHLGETIDIHCGGSDLIFPHHENERAQSMCAHNGATFSRYWIHNSMITIEGEKMSKSLGNIFLIRELLEALPGELLRFMIISTHYRKPLDWTAEGVKQAQSRLNRMYASLEKMAHIHIQDDDLVPSIEVLEALRDDLNTPGAISAMDALIKKAASAEAHTLSKLKGQILASGALMGLLQDDPQAWLKQGQKTDLDPTEIESLIEARKQARFDKNFAEADRIRDDLLSRKIILKDSPEGTSWEVES